MRASGGFPPSLPLGRGSSRFGTRRGVLIGSKTPLLASRYARCDPLPNGSEGNTRTAARLILNSTSPYRRRSNRTKARGFIGDSERVPHSCRGSDGCKKQLHRRAGSVSDRRKSTRMRELFDYGSHHNRCRPVQSIDKHPTIAGLLAFHFLFRKALCACVYPGRPSRPHSSDSS